MQYTLVVAKDVAIPVQDFVTQWNADPACYAMAYASIDDSIKSVYSPDVRTALPTLDVQPVEIDQATFHALIKRTLQTSPLYPPTEIVELAKPNGTRVLVVKSTATGISGYPLMP
ncbi:MAG: hypothetical protein NT075_01710 [Chloroflexi bacterium]|nr:hypothetical protein [Chloroflexota bacterium]